MRTSVIIIVAVISCAGCSTTKKTSYQNGVDDGYKLGTSDAIKRQYWVKQAAERKNNKPESKEGRTVYYTMDGPQVGEDGRKLVPSKVVVPVKE